MRVLNCSSKGIWEKAFSNLVNSQMAEENSSKPSGFRPPPLLSSLSKPAKLSAAPSGAVVPPPTLSGASLPIPSRPKSVKTAPIEDKVDAPPVPVIKKQSIMVQKDSAKKLAATLSPHTEEVRLRRKIGTRKLTKISKSNTAPLPIKMQAQKYAASVAISALAEIETKLAQVLNPLVESSSYVAAKGKPVNTEVWCELGSSLLPGPIFTLETLAANGHADVVASVILPWLPAFLAHKGLQTGESPPRVLKGALFF
jgi:hypothetical protein